jgi:hypothetical protein
MKLIATWMSTDRDGKCVQDKAVLVKLRSSTLLPVIPLIQRALTYTPHDLPT